MTSNNSTEKLSDRLIPALIDAGADVNKTDNDGQTPLFYAVQQSNHESVVRALINAGADVNKADNDGQTPLFYAVQQSNYESVVRALIKAGADVNKAYGVFDQTALFYAVQESNNEKVVRALIDAGADVNKAYGVFDQTALIDAVRQSNNVGVVCALLDAPRADVNITDLTDQTALHYAVQQTNEGEHVVCALITAGADVNKIETLEGKTALFYAVQQSNNERVVRALIDAGGDVNITDNSGQSALFHAVQQSNNESVVRALIDDGSASVDVRDVDGRTPLFYALNCPNLARILVEKGEKYLFYLKDNSDCSVLNFFVDKYLLQYDTADVSDSKDDENREDSASQIILSGFFDLLEECKVQKITFAEAILNIAFCKVIPLMFQKRPVLGSLQTWQITRVLKLAGQVIDNQKEMEKLIVLINEKCTKGEGVPEALQLLVELGADPNSVDSDGNTALHYASGLALKGVPQEIVMEICLQLENIGVRFNLRNHKNQTPLLYGLSTHSSLLEGEKQFSVVKTLVEVCRFLSEHGFIIEERSHGGLSVEERSPHDRGGTVFHLILTLFKEALRLSDETVRQDVLHEEMKLLKLFSPTKFENQIRTAVCLTDDDLNSPLHLWSSLELPSPQDYTSNVTRDLAFGEFLGTILNWLLQCGAKLNARNGDDQTPLHLCSTWIAVKLLLDVGANTNDVDSSKVSPLLAAVKKGYSGIYPDNGVLEDPKSFWKTSIDMGLDPWTSDEECDSVLSILIGHENYVLAKGLVDVACKEGYTKSETFAVGLLNAICKDKSTRTNWKANLVQAILNSRKCPTISSEPLRLCCRTVIETEGFDNHGEEKSTWRSSAFEMSASEDDEEEEDEEKKKEKEKDDDKEEEEEEGQSKSKKRRTDTLVHSKEKEFEQSSVHCKIIKILRLYGADGKSCLDLANTSAALKELLTKPLDFSTVSVVFPWTSISNKYEVKLAKVARLQECDVIHEEFWCHKEPIGSGSFGDVFVGINEKDGREVAIKRIVKLRMQRPEDKREITNLTTLADSEQVVRYLHFFEDEKFSYIVLELMEGDLDEYLTDGSTFDARKSTQLCGDVVKGLKLLHAWNIIHRDLKPGNILFKTRPLLCLKIADFGLSKVVDSISTTVYCTNAGTRCWMAPELLKQGSTDHSKASDMFSCGLVLHYILSVQKHPFSKNNSQMAHQIETNIENGRMEGWDDSLSPEATHIVKNMLLVDEKDRPTAGDALDHPLFWSKKRKVDFLIAVGNQSVFGYPRARRSLTALTPVETDLENKFSTIVVYGMWNDPRYKNMPHIFTGMTSTKRKSYDTHSVVELVWFIRNAYAHVSEATRPTLFRKMLLEDFVFLEYFPHLVIEVYKVVTHHGWDQTVEEIKYAMNK